MADDKTRLDINVSPSLLSVKSKRQFGIKINIIRMMMMTVRIVMIIMMMWIMMTIMMMMMWIMMLMMIRKNKDCF